MALIIVGADNGGAVINISAVKTGRIFQFREAPAVLNGKTDFK